ncbi:MAG: citramalate synthase [Deltaproteobacteria bacterium]|nr:citramalate synthase [Candidatus Anaeroferrophillus wilburensis]MBN2888281.1 citramalate synthase [Deltaproteobacteria bacterium]
MAKIKIYDTTLRDGTQAEEISLLAGDKVRIARKLDEFGIHYIEGGWPGSNPKDISFFKKIKNVSLKTSKITAFGSTRKFENQAEHDQNLQAILDSGVRVATIFGKSWDFHVTNALNIGLHDNLAVIEDTLAYLKGKMAEVIYDAEHFFDGYKHNSDYALETLKAAMRGGADCLVLCDTNGGTLPCELTDIIKAVQKELQPTLELGIHVHNDSGVAVANSLAAVSCGITHVQGTINGFGERCGNANLISIIPNLQLKLGHKVLPRQNLQKLSSVSRFVDEIANKRHNNHQPFVGMSAFAHKGGIHVSAVQKDPLTYEHISPDWVGNQRRVLVSDLSGRSNILYKAQEYNLDVGNEEQTRAILKRIKDLEDSGFQFEGAEASFELLVKKTMGTYKPFFDLKGFRVIVEKFPRTKTPVSEATIMLRVNKKIEHTAAIGDGPVDALDKALRKALDAFFPIVKEIKLTDYKVRILSSDRGTKAVTRVLIETQDSSGNKWGTVGVSDNIIEASWQALVDSIEYKLMQEGGEPNHV